jgi:hypothetical protein
VQGLLVALVGGLLAQVGSLAVQRSDISTPDTPRYLYIIVALLLPLIGLAVSGVTLRAGRAVVGLFLAYLVVTQGVVLLAAERPLESPRLHTDVLGYASLLQRGEPVYPTAMAIDVDERSVGTWAATGKLGSLAGVPEQAVSDARALTQVRLVPTGPPRVVAGELTPAPGQVRSGRCETTATTTGELAATLAIGPARTVSVVAPNGGHLAFQVVGQGPASRLVQVPLDPHRTYWFTAARDLSVQVVASEGQALRLCAGEMDAGS